MSAALTEGMEPVAWIPLDALQQLFPPRRYTAGVELILFYLGCFLFWLFFHLTRREERRDWTISFFAVCALAGATGFIWERLARRGG
jgi:uncharacterized membrane protein YtjA (UPF0391 family)